MLEFEDLGMENWQKFEGLILNSEKIYPDKIRTTKEEYLDILKDGSAIAKVAKLGQRYVGNVIGFRLTEKEIKGYGLTGVSRNSVYLLNFVIDPEHQGRGFGKELLAEFIRAARSMGCDKLVGHFRPNNSLALVKRLGGREIGVSRNWEGTGEDYVLCFLDIGRQQI